MTAEGIRSTYVTLDRAASGVFLNMSDGTDDFDFFNNAGTPEGAIAADIGSMCTDTTNGELYIKQTDTVNTGWVKVQLEPDVTWIVDTTTPQALLPNVNHFATTLLINYTLPATASVGDTYIISDSGGFLFTVTTAAGQTIRLGNRVTGAGGGTFFASTEIGDTVEIVCRVTNTGFQVVDSIGNFTVTP